MLRLRENRARKGISQAELASRAGITQGYLSDLENGNQNPSLDVLIRLANVLDCKLDDLVMNEDEDAVGNVKLREIRVEKQLTQKRLADISGVAREVINRIENGKSNPDTMTLIRLAKALDCKLDDLVDMDSAS